MSTPKQLLSTFARAKNGVQKSPIITDVLRGNRRITEMSAARRHYSAASPHVVTPQKPVPTPPPSSSPSSPESPPDVNPLKNATVLNERYVGKPMYDVLIVGGGVTGSSLLYQLSKFTDIKRIGLVERRADFAVVASGPNNNSQTIHCGDIETNYTLEKAKTVKRHADMLRNYGTHLPPADRDRCIFKMQKMVMGVGEVECSELERRFEVFKEVFPKMELCNKDQLRDIEPNLIRISNHRDRQDLVNAIVIKDEHSAVNYYTLTRSFIQQAQQNTDKMVDVRLKTEVLDIKENDDKTFSIKTNQGDIKTRFLVVSACGYSLLMAHRLGYGQHFSCLPVAGSFYFSKKPVLVGKVYTVQDPSLPFAAVHGDPDVAADGMTRFGPTALPMPLLERYNMSTFLDFLKVSQIDFKTAIIYINMWKDRNFRNYAIKNLVFELPYFGIGKFLHDARKIIPGMERQDLMYAEGYGGIRPQMIDRKKMKMILGEGKILGRRSIFNITPSPGGTTCLGNGETDMRMICKELGANIYEEKFKANLLDGEYAIAQ